MRALIGRNAFMPVLWDPLAEFERLSNELWHAWEYPTTYARLPYMDIAEEDGSIVVKEELPGMSPEEIDVTLNDGVLTIKAEHSEGEKEGGNGYHSLRYYRSIALPSHVDSEKVTAGIEHGILEVRFPKTEALDTKRVEVKILKEPKSKTKRAKRAKNAKKEAEGKK